ncbi:response regulator [Deinococcus deserti]|uniref:response regulator n=1 Tax=Deinococcus deserti TaxID=310783 RepID=UPI0001994EC5
MPVPCHALLIGDNASGRMLAQEASEQLRPECTLTTTAEGKKALQLLRNESLLPDVVLLDINMPAMSGFELL